MSPVYVIYFVFWSQIFNIQYTNGQITHGVILFERKTNLLKKYDSPESQRWLRGEKIKIDRFNFCRQLILNRIQKKYKEAFLDRKVKFK